MDYLPILRYFDLIYLFYSFFFSIPQNLKYILLFFYLNKCFLLNSSQYTLYTLISVKIVFDKLFIPKRRLRNKYKAVGFS